MTTALLVVAVWLCAPFVVAALITWTRRSRQLRVACGWCGRQLRRGVEPTSHSICPACKAIFFPANDEPSGLVTEATLGSANERG